MKKYVFIVIVFALFLGRIFYLNINEHNKYVDMLKEKTNNYVTGGSAPRGRIIDRNGKILVDNKGIKTVFYTKLKGINTKDELDIAKKLSNILAVEIDEDSLKTYYLITHNNGDDLITDNEYQLFKERKLTSKDLKKLKVKNIMCLNLERN